MFQRPEVTPTSKKEISQALSKIEKLLKTSRNTKLPTLLDYINPSSEPTQYSKPKKQKQPMPTIDITANKPNNNIDNTANNFMTFINHIKQPYQPLEITINENGKKQGYEKCKKEWRDKSFNECQKNAEEFNKNNNTNSILYKCPTNLIIIDTDSPESYDIVRKFYKQHDYKIVSTKSFSNNIENYYKKHYYFKIECDTKENAEQYGNYDILHAGANVAEKTNADINIDDIPTITQDDYNVLYGNLKMISLKTNTMTKKANTNEIKK